MSAIRKKYAPIRRVMGRLTVSVLAPQHVQAPATTSCSPEALSQVLLQGGADLRMAKAKLHVGDEVAKLVTGVEPLGIDHRGQHALTACQPSHGISELDLATAPRSSLAQIVEDAALENIAAGEGQAARRLAN